MILIKIITINSIIKNNMKKRNKKVIINIKNNMKKYFSLFKRNTLHVFSDWYLTFLFILFSISTCLYFIFLWDMIDYTNIKDPLKYFLGYKIVGYIFLWVSLYSFYIVLYSIKINKYLNIYNKKWFQKFIEYEYQVHKNQSFFKWIDFFFVVLLSILSYITSQSSVILSFDLHNSAQNGITDISKTNNYISIYSEYLAMFALGYIVFFIIFRLLKVIKLQYIEEIFLQKYIKK